MVSTPPTAPASPDSDALLVERAVNGDTRAFEMLVIKYQRRVERLVARMVRDVDLVPDITQETFIRAYRALAQFRGDAQFYTWLYRIAVNTAKKQLLSMKNDPLVLQSLPIRKHPMRCWPARRSPVRSTKRWTRCPRS